MHTSNIYTDFLSAIIFTLESEKMHSGLILKIEMEGKWSAVSLSSFSTVRWNFHRCLQSMKECC